MTTDEPRSGVDPQRAAGRRSRALVGSLAAAVLSLIAVAIALPVLTPAIGVSVGADRLVNEPGIIDAHNSPTVVRNPRRGDNLVIANRIDRPRFGSALLTSADGGASWDEVGLPLPEGLDRAYAPDLAFGSDGTLYASYVNLGGTGNVPENVWLARSTDGGRTFGAPVRVAGPLAFQVRIAVDHGSGRVYLTWLQAAEVGLLKLTGRPNPVVSATSLDGGRTFLPPVAVSDPERVRVGAASPVVDAAGALVVLYQDFADDRRDFEFLEGPPWDRPFALVATRSDDGGRSFARGVVVDDEVVAARRFLVFLPVFPSLAAAADGSLYVAWSDGRDGEEDVAVRRSEDGGATWGPRRRVGSPATVGSARRLPEVDVAPNGRVDVLFLEQRRDQGRTRLHATLATSFDDARSFEAHRLARRPSDPEVGPSVAARIGVDLGSRLGVESGDDRTVAVWTDTRLGTVDSGRQDLGFSLVAFHRAPVPRARLAVGAALLALAAAALAVAVTPRRRAQPARST